MIGKIVIKQTKRVQDEDNEKEADIPTELGGEKCGNLMIARTDADYRTK